MHFPLPLAGVIGSLMRPFDRRLSALFAFGVATSRVDCLAPMTGSRTLEAYYAEVVGREQSA